MGCGASQPVAVASAPAAAPAAPSVVEFTPSQLVEAMGTVPTVDVPKSALILGFNLATIPETTESAVGSSLIDDGAGSSGSVESADSWLRRKAGTLTASKQKASTIVIGSDSAYTHGVQLSPVSESRAEATEAAAVHTADGTATDSTVSTPAAVPSSPAAQRSSFPVTPAAPATPHCTLRASQVTTGGAEEDEFNHT